MRAECAHVGLYKWCDDARYADAVRPSRLYRYYNLIPLYTIVNTTKNLGLYNWTVFRVFFGGGGTSRVCSSRMPFF